MSHHQPADREPELELFDQIVAGQVLERILLLEAEGQIGKTTLMQAFDQRCPAHVPSAPLDLKGRSTSRHEFLYRICDSLG